MKNYILDVDGTLWDTTEVVAEAWNYALKDLKIEREPITSEELKSLFGQPMDIIIKKILRNPCHKDEKEFFNLCRIYESDFLNKTNDYILYPSVVETVKALSLNHNLFIVSNCQNGYIELFLNKSNLQDYIIDYECYGNTGKYKAENISLLIKRNKLTDCAYVGDIESDFQSSKKVGIPFIYAKYGFGEVENPDYVIEKFSDLLKI